MISYYSLHKHEVSETHDEDMTNEYQRMLKLNHVSPFECEYLKKIQYPETAIKTMHFVRLI